MKLDDNNSMPLYLQLKNTIKGLIDSVKLKRERKFYQNMNFVRNTMSVVLRLETHLLN